MPFNSFDFACGVLSFGQESMTVESQVIVSVCLGTERPGTHPAEFYGQILIISTETPNLIPIAILASGHFGANDYIAWTGRIEMDPSYAILARVWADDVTPLRCTILTEAI